MIFNLINKNRRLTIGAFFMLLALFCRSQSLTTVHHCLRNQQNELVKHQAYSLSYNEAHEQANWVSYLNTRAHSISNTERGNDFREDPSVKTGSAELRDYSGSGYDRGHLAPAADMAWSELAMSESFFLSNMSPQLPGFNRGIWKQLEALVRSWASEYDSILVVTGPVLREGLAKIGPNQVSVPEQYYKVVYRLKGKEFESIAFILSQQAHGDLKVFATSVKSIENMVGIDFLSGYADAHTKESKLCLECWTWDIGHVNDRENLKETTAVRCSAMNKSGSRCKNTTKDPSGLCGTHRK